MILFSSPGFEHQASRLQPNLVRGKFSVNRFDNGEIFTTVSTSVFGEDCAILGTIAPPDEQLLSLALLAHTLRKDGARTITALLPYLAYSRQDKNKPGESLAAAWTGCCLRISGVDRVVTIDAHSDRGCALYTIPVTNLSPAALFARTLAENRLPDATIIAPDEGAIPRCEAVHHALGRKHPNIPHLIKHREHQQVRHTELCGSTSKIAVLIDDILDTGDTLVSACEILRHAGAQKIFILITHGLFTGHRWRQLWNLGVQHIFCTDTVPQRSATARGPRISVLPAASLLRSALLTNEPYNPLHTVRPPFYCPATDQPFAPPGVLSAQRLASATILVDDL